MASVKKAQVIITADASVAKKVMDELQQRATQAANKMKQLAAAGKQNSKEFKAAKKDFDAYNSALRENVKDTKRVEEVMKNLAGTATRDLKRALQAGKRELDKFAADDPRRQKLIADLQKINAQIQKNTGSLNAMTKAQNGFGASLKTTLKNLVDYAGVFALFNRIKSTLTDLYKKNIQLSDELTNVRKVSQLAAEDINRMAVAIAKIDTRTSVHELNNLAYAGAKLGMGQYGAEGLVQFVKAADKVNVALKEDLGEDALTAMSKLVEVMGLIPKMGIEKSMDAAGSAIFTLSTSSTATGANIIEFSKRLMGLANVSHVLVPELLGLASASDAMGLMPEVSATAFNKVFTSIQSNYTQIEKAVGLTKGSLKELLEQGKTMEAVVKVFDEIHGMSMEEMKGRGIFKALGSDGARLNNVIATMSDRIDMLKDHLDMSNESFEDATAVQKEYAMQMESAAGYADRAANVWEKAFVNPEGVDMVKRLAVEWYNTSKEMTSSASTMNLIKGTIENIADVIKVVIKVLPLLIKYMMFYGVGTAIQMVYRNVVALSAALASASGAAGKLNAVMKANVFAFALSTVLTFVTTMNDFAAAEDEAAKKGDTLSQAIAEAESNYQKQKATLDDYIKKLNDTTLEEKEREKVMRAFNNEFGAYMDKLGIESSGVLKLAGDYKALNEELKKAAYYRMGEKLRASYIGEEENKETEALGKLITLSGKYGFNVDKVIQAREGGATTAFLLQNIYDQMYGRKFGVNGKLKWSSSNPYQYEISAKDHRSTKPLTGGSEQTEQIYKAVEEYYSANEKKKTRTNQVNDLLKSLGVYDYDDPTNGEMSLKKAFDNLKQLSKVSLDDLNRGLSTLRKEWSKLTGEEQDADKNGKGQGLRSAMDKYEEQIRKMSYIPQPTEKELTEAQKKEKSDMTEEKKEAEKATKAVIGAIEEFYRLQEAAANELAANGQLKGTDFEMLIKHIQDRKDKMLLEARRAIAGDPNEFEKERKLLQSDIVKRDDKVSQAAMQRIQEAEPAKKGAVLRKYDGSDAVYGLDSNAWLNDVRKNAAQNELNIQRRQAKVQEEIDKILMQYEFVQQAQKTFGDKLVKLGLITDGYDKVVQQLADGTEIVANTKDVQALANKTIKMDSRRMYGVDTDDALELRNMIDAVMHTVDEDGNKVRESFAGMFPNLDEWMKNPEQYKEQMQAFYKALIDMDSDYYKALKQNYEQESREFKERWQSMGWTTQQESENTAFETQDSIRKIQGDPNGYWKSGMREYGFADTIADDPEIARIKNRMEWRARELEDLQARNASEELIMQKQNEMLKEAASLAEKVSQEVANRISKVQTLSEPLNSFGEEVGQMLGEQWQGISREGKLSFGEMAKNMGIEYAKLTLKMASENLIKKLQQGLFYKQMEMQEMQHQVQLTNIQNMGNQARIAGQITTGTTLQTIKSAQDATEIGQEGGKATIMTMFGISEGAAKTIAKLGFWGIPLIGVITSILMGLLNSAKATASQESSSSASSSNEATKIKLVSGMLTYDGGNVGTYAGTDGHVYRAANNPAPGTGLITRPIATTVQGNPALVAERGPEIVIGRRATANIMRWNPALLNVLASYDPHSPRRHTYDEGTTVPSVAPALPSTSGEGQDPRMEATLASLAQTVALLSATVSDLQKKGIPAHINKYGTGGLIDEVKSGLKFDARYSG